ncbi:MAG: TIGR03663 family protein, partial [Chloroflexi bacterium]
MALDDPSAPQLDDNHARGNVAVYTPPRRGAMRFRITLESILWICLGVLATLTRFWDLGSRAQHHDESLHVYYSWLLAVGAGYIHDPLMHGPSLFHTTALAYFLFGDNDYSSRVFPAVCGVLLVLMPWLLRGPNLLGRWGALTLGTLILFSPTLLYYTRFIRHDPYILVGTLGVIIACLRYLERPAPRWVMMIGLCTGFLFATMEVSFIVGFVIVTFLVAVVTWQVAKPLFVVGLGTLAALAGVWFIMPRLGAAPLPAIPWEHPTNQNIRQFTLDLVQHPIVLASLGVLLLGLIAGLAVIDKVRDPDADGWLDGVLGKAPDGSSANRVYLLLKDKRTLGLAVLGGATIYVVLYTTMFTNMPGLASGTVGALGYWLGQHGVQRAEQPWFYYLLMLPQYEFIGVLLFPVGLLITVRKLVPHLLHGAAISRRDYLRGFVVYWALMHLAIFSWAGEKMPWLTVHMTLPLLVLAASVIGEALEWVEARLHAGMLSRQAAIAVAVGIPLLTGAWFMLWAWGTAGPWVQGERFVQRTLRPEVADNPWLLYLPLLGLLALLAIGWRKLGAAALVRVAGISLVAVTLLGQIHTGFRMSYIEGDTPVDMLIYVQSTPDVTRVVEEMGI